MKTIKSKVKLAIALIIIIVFAFIIWGVTKRSSYSSNYEKIKIGDSKQMVIELLGQPTVTENCHDSKATDDLNRNCIEEYWYKSFLEKWGISFDKNNQVIYKTYNVLY